MSTSKGGIAIDSSGNLFIPNDGDSDDGNNVIIKVEPDGSAIGGGAASIFVSQAAISAVTGNEIVDLDTASVWYGSLFVADDGADAVLRIDDSGTVTLLASEAELLAVVPTLTEMDVEGGLAVDASGRVYLADDGKEDEGPDRANLFRINGVSETELFVSASEVDTFYQARYPGVEPRFRGSMAFARPFLPIDQAVTPVPTLPLFGLLALGGLLGLFGLRKLKK